jgi:hypothetical protein
MPQRLFRSPGTPVETVGEKESLREAAGRVHTMAAVFCVDCGLKLTGRYCMKCGRDHGATAAAQCTSSTLATTAVQHVGSLATSRVRQQQDVSSSTTGAKRAISPLTRIYKQSL